MTDYYRVLRVADLLVAQSWLVFISGLLGVVKPFDAVHHLLLICLIISWYLKRDVAVLCGWIQVPAYSL